MKRNPKKTGSHNPMKIFPSNPVQLPVSKTTTTKKVSSDLLSEIQEQEELWEDAINGKTGKSSKAGKKGYNNWAAGAYVSCYESHPAMPLGNGWVIYGGSCITPVVLDADVYVGLDRGMHVSERSLPWCEKPTTEFLYPITDMSVPKDATSFVKLIAWLSEQVMAGKKVHVGCIGGHGRTGMVFAALVKVMLGEADAIAYVRKHYCKKAVETETQIKFLMDVFGISTAKPSKTWSTYTATTTTGGKPEKPGLPTQGEFPAVQSTFCCWGRNAIISSK